MLNRKEVLAEIENLSTLKELVEAYEEIAANHMRKIRSSVLKTRDFLTGLTEIFQEVKLSYRREILLLQKMKKIKDDKLSVVKKNGKTVSLFLSSNTGLYGDIVKRTFQTFDEHLTSMNSRHPALDAGSNPKSIDSGSEAGMTGTDVVIVGRLGYVLFKEQHPNETIKYFDFPDSSVDMNKLKEIIEYLLQYEKVLVFFGQFQSLVNQSPSKLDVYGDIGSKEMPASEIQSKDSKETILKGGLAFSKVNKDENIEGVARYLFEPTLENIMLFFEAEIIGSIFEQTVHESNLAKFAARMFTLDKATVNIKSRLKNSESERRIVAHRLMNKKQLEGLSGMTLWGK